VSLPHGQRSQVRVLATAYWTLAGPFRPPAALAAGSLYNVVLVCEFSKLRRDESDRCQVRCRCICAGADPQSSKRSPDSVCRVRSVASLAIMKTVAERIGEPAGSCARTSRVVRREGHCVRAPRTPQMNGRDRMNLTLRQKAQPMLSDARMPASLESQHLCQRCHNWCPAEVLHCHLRGDVECASDMNPAVALHRTHTPLGAGFIGFLYVRRQMAAKSASAALRDLQRASS
jgi:hypothetical protein